MKQMWCRRLQRDEQGAQAVEFALIFLFILGPFITAFVTFAVALNAQINITQGAREGARLAAICNMDTSSTGCTAADIKSKVQTSTGLSTIQSNRITITACSAPTAANPKPSASVTVTYVSNVGLPPFAAAGITLTGKSSTPCGG